MNNWMVLLGASLTAATASAPLAAMQDVAWPSGFAATAAAGDGWKPYRLEGGGFALRLSLPPQWVEQTQPSRGDDVLLWRRTRGRA